MIFQQFIASAITSVSTSVRNSWKMCHCPISDSLLLIIHSEPRLLSQRKSRGVMRAWKLNVYEKKKKRQRLHLDKHSMYSVFWTLKHRYICGLADSKLWHVYKIAVREWWRSGSVKMLLLSKPPLIQTQRCITWYIFKALRAARF